MTTDDAVASYTTLTGAAEPTGGRRSGQLGVQTVRRAVALLGVVARSGDQGESLTEIARSSALNIATARRILQALVAEGLLSFEMQSRRYSIGPTIVAFAVQALPWFSQRSDLTRALDEIAKLTGETALFSIRVGDEAVCLDRREGGYPVRVMSLGPGDRRPLGVGSGSAAILSALPDSEQQAILSRNETRILDYGLTLEQVSTMVDEARRVGFTYNAGALIEGVHGIGVPILGDSGAVAAVSVVAVAARMQPDRRSSILETVRKCLASVGGISFRLPTGDS